MHGQLALRCAQVTQWLDSVTSTGADAAYAGAGAGAAYAGAGAAHCAGDAPPKAGAGCNAVAKCGHRICEPGGPLGGGQVGGGGGEGGAVMGGPGTGPGQTRLVLPTAGEVCAPSTSLMSPYTLKVYSRV